MRSPLSGSIATCLIFVPLVAVPALAVLGMPQLSTSAATVAGDDFKLAENERVQTSPDDDLGAPVQVSGGRTDAGANRDESSTARDPFAEFTRDDDGARRHSTSVGPSASARRPQRWTNEGNGIPQKALFSSERLSEERATNSPQAQPADRGSLQNSPDQSANDASSKTPVARRALPEAEAVVTLPSESAAAPPRDSAPETRRAVSDASPASRQALAWKQAVGRLNALGIRDYQLQPGEREGEFNFSCRFAARNNPRVIHRFEAEAADPLEAVNEVLRQLDDWRIRHAARNQAARDSVTEGNSTSRVAESSEVEMTNRAF
ncbi:MAG TPA: hypothetical protein VEI07_01935 [Planctomycetaceae bacterium]|nr:hypothetical protein [Planctomycetaceae bacterium]